MNPYGKLLLHTFLQQLPCSEQQSKCYMSMGSHAAGGVVLHGNQGSSQLSFVDSKPRMVWSRSDDTPISRQVWSIGFQPWRQGWLHGMYTKQQCYHLVKW